MEQHQIYQLINRGLQTVQDQLAILVQQNGQIQYRSHHTLINAKSIILNKSLLISDELFMGYLDIHNAFGLVIIVILANVYSFTVLIEMVGQTMGSNHTTFHSSFEQFNIIVPSNTDTIKFFIDIFTQILFCHTV